MRATFAGVLGLGALAVAIGCEGVTNVLEDKAQQVAEKLADDPSATASSPAPTEDELLTRKLRLYVECHGRATERIRSSWQRYAERIDDDGTLRKKGTTPFLYKIDTELAPCEDAARRGPTMRPPRPAIESAMADYVEHGRTFAGLSVELDSYFERKLYQEDDWAKSKQLAPGFRLAFEAWSKAAATLDRELGIHLDRLDRSRLAALERSGGQTLEWHARLLTLEARAFMRCASAEDVDAEACRKRQATLAEADAGFRRVYGTDPRAAEVFWMDSFHESTATYVERTGEVLDALDEGPLSPEALRPVERAHTAVVSDSNNLRFDR